MWYCFFLKCPQHLTLFSPLSSIHTLSLLFQPPCPHRWRSPSSARPRRHARPGRGRHACARARVGILLGLHPARVVHVLRVQAAGRPRRPSRRARACVQAEAPRPCARLTSRLGGGAARVFASRHGNKLEDALFDFGSRIPVWEWKKICPACAPVDPKIYPAKVLPAVF
jgi:hypothetical protein